MREVFSFLGVLAIIAVFVMICRCPEAKENFSKENQKAMAITIIPMIVLVWLVHYLLSHVGL